MEELPVTHPDFGKWRRGLRVNDPDAWLAKYALSPEIIAKPIAAELEVQPLGYEDEAPDLAAENEALRSEVETLRKELAARPVEVAPVPLPPNPAETKLADYYIPAEIRDLMEEGETFPQARKRLSELLNVEKAELRLKRAAGSATEAELKREADVDRLQGLFSKLGEI